MFNLAKKLFPICRSLTGEGNRKTLKIIKKIIPELKIYEIPSNQKIFDWKVPKEWNVKDAYIKANGKKIVDFKESNLHLMGYSTPVNSMFTHKELSKHIYYLKDQKKFIPYITSYYKKNWGFCVSYEHFKKKFKSKNYYVRINSELKNGHLTYADYLIKGKSKSEILISCNICHPSMANNEISGMVVATELIKYFKKFKNYYSLRFVFIPETIGAIIYINKNIKILKKNVKAGYVLTCIGDNLNYSFLPSREGNTLSDKAALNYLNFEVKKFKKYSFLDRGSDERQYCSPNINLPISSLMRSKYNTYPEYHTSGDNLDFINEKGLRGGFNYVKNIIIIIQNNFIYKSKIICEPQMSSRNLYPTISSRKNSPLSAKSDLKLYLDFIAFADGKNDLIDISNILNVSVLKLIEIKKQLVKLKLIERIK